MKCAFCGREITNESPYKMARCRDFAKNVADETFFLCDGYSLSEAMGQGIITLGFSIPMTPSPQEVIELSSRGLCAQIFKNQMAFSGKTVSITVCGR